MNNQVLKLPRIVPHAWSSGGCLWCGELNRGEICKPCPRKTCKTWYEVLVIPLYANVDQIRNAYQRLAEEWNPARLKTRDDIVFDGGFSETQMKWFNAAYAVLMNPVEREQHDVEILSTCDSESGLTN